jgi:DNA modification methylase
MNFIAGFSPEFVRDCINAKGLGLGDSLLDPFAGMGTALLEANLAGLDASGYEAHPFIRDVAEAKLVTRDVSQVDEVARLLARVRSVENLESVWTEKALVFLMKLVDSENLSFLAGARLLEPECDPRSRHLYRLVVSRLLELAAGSATDGIYKAPTTKKRSIKAMKNVVPLVTKIRGDVESLPPSMGISHLIGGTSENMSDALSDAHDICVTSPPYLNNFDFAEMTRMELYFWDYASTWAEITERVRAKLIVNTTTAPTPLRRDQSRWADLLPEDFRNRVQPLIDELGEQKKLRGGSKEYHSLVLPYFAQMSSVIAEVHRVLKPTAPFHTVVADAALYGVHVHTEELLAELMTKCGFEVKEVIRLRDRGGRWVLAKRQGAPTPLGEFHIHAVKKETISP